MSSKIIKTNTQSGELFIHENDNNKNENSSNDTAKRNERNSFSILIEKIQSGKVPKIVIIIVAFLIILFILFNNFGFTDKKKITTDNEQTSIYIENLESKLSKVLSNVDGAGKVNVVISYESGKETVLATKKTTTKIENGKSEIEETPIIVNGKTVTIKELNPKIIGVLIVSQGANSLMVKKRLQQATISLLDININQIEILTMK